MHNPTRRSHKAQYKSAVWWHSPDQEAAVREALDAFATRGIAIATTVGPAQPWWRAEDRHQQYYFKRR
jgi:peptide methionine sulfoxide reductase MsrA